MAKQGPSRRLEARSSEKVSRLCSAVRAQRWRRARRVARQHCRRSALSLSSSRRARGQHAYATRGEPETLASLRTKSILHQKHDIYTVSSHKKRERERERERSCVLLTHTRMATFEMMDCKTGSKERELRGAGYLGQRGSAAIESDVEELRERLVGL